MNPAGLGPAGETVLEPQWVKSIITNSAGEKGLSRSGVPRGAGLSLGPGGVRRRGCLGRTPTIKVYGAVPVEVHIPEHLIQVGLR